jgi:predicted phage terminase large subunit-like protein
MKSYPKQLLYYPERTDLTKFTEALGYENAPFHKEWYRYLQNTFSPLKTHPEKQKRFLLLWPRGHAKTETTTINYASWLVGNYQDIHINIVTKTASLAEEILTALITRFESDERYKQIFGNLKPQSAKKWTSQELIVARGEISKNPTLKATGLMGPITGGRSDLIICDDIIDEENVRTSLQLEKVNTWFNKVLIPTLYPWGGIIAIGTRWSYADIYAELLQKWPSDTKQAIQKDGTALWPEYWSLQKLEERRNEIGTIFFNCQYQNDPTSMQGDLLKSEWLHAWEQLPPSNLPVYAGVDPSLGEGDYFGIASLAYDPTMHQGYLLDVWAEHMPFPQIMKEKLPQLHRTYRYAKIFMETNFWQKILTYMPELQGLPIVPVKTVADKQSRFIPMSSHFESKRVLINPLLDRKSEFWNEWVQFPRGQHDDALDCTEIVVTNVIGTKKDIHGWVLG